MKIHEIINEDISRRGFLKGAGAAAAGMAGVSRAKADWQEVGSYNKFDKNTTLDGYKNISDDGKAELWLDMKKVIASVVINVPRKRLTDSDLFHSGFRTEGGRIINSPFRIRLGKQVYSGQAASYGYIKNDTIRMDFSFNDATLHRAIEQSIHRQENIDLEIGWLNNEVFHFIGKKGSPTVKEDTSVNMSPYKEAIQNAETPKKKSAKSKVEQLFNK